MNLFEVHRSHEKSENARAIKTYSGSKQVHPSTNPKQSNQKKKRHQTWRDKREMKHPKSKSTKQKSSMKRRRDHCSGSGAESRPAASRRERPSRAGSSRRRPSKRRTSPARRPEMEEGPRERGWDGIGDVNASAEAERSRCSRSSTKGSEREEERRDPFDVLSLSRRRTVRGNEQAKLSLVLTTGTTRLVGLDFDWTDAGLF